MNDWRNDIFDDLGFPNIDDSPPHSSPPSESYQERPPSDSYPERPPPPYHANHQVVESASPPPMENPTYATLTPSTHNNLPSEAAAYLNSSYGSVLDSLLLSTPSALLTPSNSSPLRYGSDTSPLDAMNQRLSNLGLMDAVLSPSSSPPLKHESPFSNILDEGLGSSRDTNSSSPLNGSPASYESLGAAANYGSNLAAAAANYGNNMAAAAANYDFLSTMANYDSGSNGAAANFDDGSNGAAANYDAGSNGAAANYGGNDAAMNYDASAMNVLYQCVRCGNFGFNEHWTFTCGNWFCDQCVAVAMSPPPEPPVEEIPRQRAARRPNNNTLGRVRGGRVQKAPKEEKNHICFNCGHNLSSLWRRMKNSGETVCNSCGLYFKLHECHRPPHMWKKGEIQRRQRKKKNPQQ